MIKAIGLVLLALLKILGFAVLILLLLVLAVLLLVTFVPVRYRAAAQNGGAFQSAEAAQDGGNFQSAETAQNGGAFQSAETAQENLLKDFRVHAGVTWLLHFISVSFDYDSDGLKNSIRIAGIDVLKAFTWLRQKKQARQERRAKKQRRKRLRAEKKAKPADIEPSGTETFAAETLGQKPESGETAKPDDADFNAGESSLSGGTGFEAEESGVSDEAGFDAGESSLSGEAGFEAEERGASGSIRRKRKQAKKKAAADKNKKSGFRKKTADKGTKTGFHEKTTGIKDKIRQFHKEFTDESNRHVVRHLWKELCFLLRHYMPKKLKADITFSLADPAATGGVLGIISLLPFLYRYPCSIAPDFTSEKLYVQGELMLKGRVTVCIFLVSFMRLMLDKEVRQIVRRLQGK